MTREWDAGEYELLAAPMTGWGANVIERLDLQGGVTVLDVGCGTGRVTDLLLERLSRGTMLPEEEREPFTSAVSTRVAAMGLPPVMDYVRLNMTAVCAGGSGGIS